MLGVITQYLQDGYKQAAQLSTSQGLQAQAYSYLNQVNSYAQEVYGEIPNDSADLTILNAGRLGLVASQTNDCLAAIEDAIGTTRWDLAAALTQASTELAAEAATVGQDVGSAVGAVAASPFQGAVAAITSFLYSARIALFIAGGVGLVYIFRHPIGRALGKLPTAVK